MRPSTSISLARSPTTGTTTPQRPCESATPWAVPPPARTATFRPGSARPEAIRPRPSPSKASRLGPGVRRRLAPPSVNKAARRSPSPTTNRRCGPGVVACPIWISGVRICPTAAGPTCSSKRPCASAAAATAEPSVPLRITRAPGAASPRTRAPPDAWDNTLMMRGVAIQSPSCTSAASASASLLGAPQAESAVASPSARLKLSRRPILRSILSRIAIRLSVQIDGSVR